MPDTTADGNATPAAATSTTATPADASQSQTTTAATDGAPAATTTSANTDGTSAASTTTEPKPNDGEPKPGDKPANDKPAEVSYEFKLPDDVKLEGAALDELKGLAKELGLTQENAQKIADLGAKQAQAFTNQLMEHQRAQVAEWANQARADKEIGGDALNENLGTAKKALDQFATPELKKLLNDSGLGNHPEVIRTFFKVGKAISEDGRLVTGAAAQKNREDTPIANRLYPNQK
jgi:hypothetical protein